MALTTLEKTDTAAQVISEFSKKNDTGIGQVLKDTETSAITARITTPPDKAKLDTYVASIEEDSKDLSAEQKNAIWQSAVIREEAVKQLKPENAKVQASVKADRETVVTEGEGKVADPDKHIENTDAARGELHTYIRDLEAKKLTGKASPEEIAEMKLLKEERDKADTSKAFISSNGAAIRINGSAITELTANDTADEKLDGNYHGVYDDQAAAYRDFSKRWKASTNQDFALKENQRLIMYRRGDLLAYRLVESSVPSGSGQRITTISDEITFGPNKEIQTDAKQNEKEYTESTINRQGDSQFKDLPRNGEYQEPKIGFVAYGQPTDATKLEANLPAQDANKKSERYLVDFSIAEQRENWFKILLGTASEDKDSDADGVPDVLELS
ncbi:MAG: hypothetical protein EBR67_07310 [Proteobacteria bacterium]|nr:hypothetical protein [Pseudomonadota bacterium]